MVLLQRPLHDAWLHPDLNTIRDNCVGEFTFVQWLWFWLFVRESLVPDKCVGENSLCLNGYGIGFSSGSPCFRIPPYISAMHMFICFHVTDFVLKSMNLIACL